MNWLSYLLQTYTPGQLQAGISVPIPQRRTIRGTYQILFYDKSKQLIKAQSRAHARTLAEKAFNPNTIRSIRTHGIIEQKILHSPGTGIPASTLARFINGTAIPRKKSLVKLKKFYKSLHYRYLRAEGYRTDDALRACGAPPEDFYSRLDKFISNREKIAAHTDIEPLFIAWGMSQSMRNEEDWDTYTESYDGEPYAEFEYPNLALELD